jgi:hypothetical protein
MNNDLDINTENLKKDLNWLNSVIDRRFAYTFKENFTAMPSYNTEKYKDVLDIAPPDLEIRNSTYADFIDQNKLSFENRLLLILSLVHHIYPGFLDKKFNALDENFFLKEKIEKTFTKLHELGGIKTENFRGFIPTGLTWLFLLNGYDVANRIKALTELNETNILIKENIISFSNTKEYEPVLSGAISISIGWLRFFVIGDVEVLGNANELIIV